MDFQILDKMSGAAPIFTTSRLQGKNVVITGASGGIGKSTALLFARAGANVVLSARRKDALEEAVSECQAAYKAQGEAISGQKGGKFAAIVTDLRDRKSIDALHANLPEWAKGKTDIFVSNAGLVRGREHVGDIDPDEIDEMIETNVRGFIHVNQLFVKEFKTRNSGHIITIGSIAGREAYPGGSIYCATKFAVKAFTSSLLKELVNTNVRVTEIQPGMVETDFSVTRFRGDQNRADAEYKGLQPLTPQDIAEDIDILAKQDGSGKHFTADYSTILLSGVTAEKRKPDLVLVPSEWGIPVFNGNWGSHLCCGQNNKGGKLTALHL